MRAYMTFKATLVATSALVCAAMLPTVALAQDQDTPSADTPTGAATPTTDASELSSPNRRDRGEEREILVTGSRIRQDPNNSALPLQIITTETIERNGISSPEQLTMFLTTNGTGADNLASNSDVTTGAQRGTNGLSGVNLRGQGSASTLVLLNGRRWPRMAFRARPSTSTRSPSRRSTGWKCSRMVPRRSTAPTRSAA